MKKPTKAENLSSLQVVERTYVADRVTRLGEFSPDVGEWFTLGSSLKITEVAHSVKPLFSTFKVMK
jgi:hypothetical protein